MKKLLSLILILAFLSTALADFPTDVTTNRSYWWTGGAFDPAIVWAQRIDQLVGGGDQIGTGTLWYVDSGVSDAGDGSSWDNAMTTVDAAINAIYADGGTSRGDVIYVAPGHAETFSDADGFDADVAGISIMGTGNGALKPTFTFDNTASDVALGAANVLIYNVRFLAGVSVVVRGISVEDAADDCAIIGCDFPEPTSSGYEFVIGILLASGVDRFTVGNCVVYSVDAAGAATWINMDAGVNNGTMIINNTVQGDYSTAIVYSTQADLETFLIGGQYTNFGADDHVFEFTGAATGWIDNMVVSTDVYTTAIDPGIMGVGFGVGWCDADLATNTTAAPLFAMAATSVWTYDLAANNLDHLALTAVVSNTDMTAEVTDGTVLSNIMTIAGNTSDFNLATMSLQKIAADAAAILLDTGTNGVVIGADAIGAANIAVAAIGASEIATDAIGAPEIAADAITSAEIADNAIGATEIATDAIGAAEIAADAITSAEIADDAIGATEIATDAIGALEIADSAIGESEIATDAITNAEIAADAIGASEIATDAIGALEIAADAITSSEIADDAIDVGAIASAAIGADEIATDAIGAAELATDAVTEITDGVADNVASGHRTAGTVGAMQQSLTSGTATAGAAGTITLQNTASAVADYYNGNIVQIIAGTGIGQSRVITDYTITTFVASVTPNWITNPGADSVYVVRAGGPTQLEAIAAGIIDATAIATDAVDADALAADGIAEIADGIADEVASGHVTVGTLGAMLQPLTSGTSTAGAAGTITLQNTASALADFYNGNVIQLISGTGAGQSRVITDYTITTFVASVTPNWITNPAGDSVYVVYGNGPVRVEAITASVVDATAIATDAVDADALAADALAEIADAATDEVVSGHRTVGTVGAMLQPLTSGTSTAGAAGTITLQNTASALADFYNGNVVQIISGTGIGQSRVITDYAITTFIANVSPNWITNPGADSVYVVYGNGPVKVEAMAGDVITAAILATDSITNDELAASALTEIQTSVTTAIEADLLDHLLVQATADTTDPVDIIATEVADDSVLAHVMTQDGDASGFERVTDSLEGLAEGLETMLASAGNVFYVDGATGTDDTVANGHGKSWAAPFDSIDYASSQCTATNGDVILVAPGHAVTLTSTQITLAEAGVTIIALGEGSARPSVVFADGTASIDVSAGNVKMVNFRFVSNGANTAVGIDVDAAAFELIDCTFEDSGGFEFTISVDIGAASHEAVIRGCAFESLTAGATSAIASAGVSKGLVIENCYIFGDYTNAGIYATGANTSALIKNCQVSNSSTGVYAIALTAAMTGSIIDCTLAGDVYGAILDPGSMAVHNCTQSLGIDRAAIDVPLIPGKEYVMSVAADEVTQDLFSVSGPILITGWFGKVDVLIGAGATNAKIHLDDGDGAAFDHDFSTSVAIATDVAGTMYVFSDANPAVLTPLTPAASGSSILMSPWFCDTGVIEQTMDADPGGAAGDHITWYMTFTPLADNVVVVAQ